MRRIINTFKYGSVAVKLTLIATIICGLATAGLLACAVIFKQLIWFFAMIFAGFITVSLAQTFGIQGGISDEQKNNGQLNGNSDNIIADDTYNDFVSNNISDEEYADYDMDSEEDYDEEDYDEEDFDGIGKKTKKIKKKKNRKNKKTKVKKKKIKNKKAKTEKSEQKDTKLDKIKVKKKNVSGKKHKTAAVNKKALKNKPKKVAIRKDIPKVAKIAKIDIDYKAMLKKDIKDSKKDMAKKEELLEAEAENNNNVSKEAAEEENSKRSANFVPEPITAETVKQYNVKRIRKTLHKYKVKRDHKLTIIDRCETFNIYQTPAYIWVDGNDFHILLIEQEPRHLVLSTFKVGRIKYLKKQPVDINTDYKVFDTKSLVTDLFRPYLPDYNQSNVDSDLNYYKNLYGIGPGIYFTNNSAKQLIDFFGFGMDVDDKVTDSKRVNLYFKDAYKANIMVRDNVLDANGYADRISSILEEMAASSLSYNEFKETLNLMIKNKFITKEFGMYYMEVRDKKHS